MKSLPEIVFAFVYAVGTNAEPVVQGLKRYLTMNAGYGIHDFRISEYLQQLQLGITFDPSSPFNKMSALMDAGNAARAKAKTSDILAIAAVNDISIWRKSHPEVPTAHIVRSLKREEEVLQLRSLYRSGFFLIAVASSDKEQHDYLADDRGLTDAEATGLTQRDEDENVEFGQRTRDTFYLADVFVETTGKRYKKQLPRFLDLVFGDPFMTPTRDEHAMFMAYVSSARSAQMGRQVGAAITTKDGEVVAVGMNEVPASGGGPYWYNPEGNQPDNRDHKKGRDSNDEQRDQIVDSVLSSVENLVVCSERIELVVDIVLSTIRPVSTSDLRDQCISAARKSVASREQLRRAIANSKVREVTEYGRAVHAEMDALLTCARLGTPVTGKILYTTTFPCHNCTRHIIACGISKVVYIEPYPKSKAKDLHADEICFAERDAGESARIPFVPFVGVGPRRYLDLFSSLLTTGRLVKRKVNGQMVKWKRESHDGPKVAMLAATYIDREFAIIDQYGTVLEHVIRGSNENNAHYVAEEFAAQPSRKHSKSERRRRRVESSKTGDSKS